MIGQLFDDAVRTGVPVEVEYADGAREMLPLARWSGGLVPGDESLLARCVGPTLDVGCGPGRLAEAVAARGLPALGIDVTPAAVERTHQRGVLALLRDVFEPVPGQGRWVTVLLADGNIGIGGDPARLLARVRELLGTGGRALVELAPAHRARGQLAARLHSDGRSGAWFRWAEVGPDDLAGPATSAGFVVTERWVGDGRSFVELRPRETLAAA